MRLLVTAVAVLAVALAACTHETELKESPEQITQEQAAADAHNASTVPSPGDDEAPSTEPLSTTTTAVPEYEGTDALRVGNCVDLPTARTETVRAIACDRPHHAEVTERINVGARFPNGAPTPQDYDRLTESDCRPAFNAYIRQPPPTGVDVGSLNPLPESWYLGVRDIICTAEADREGNVLTGSVRKPA